MTARIMVGACPVHLEDGKHEFTIQLREPGNVTAVEWMPEERLVVARGEPAFAEVITMFVEAHENGPLRNRRFIVLPTGAPAVVPDGYAARCAGTAISARSGRVAHVFEIREVS